MKSTMWIIGLCLLLAGCGAKTEQTESEETGKNTEVVEDVIESETKENEIVPIFYTQSVDVLENEGEFLDVKNKE